MADRRNPMPRTGQRYRWQNAVILVEQVDPDGRWAMIRGAWPDLPGAEPWTKQQPIADGGFPDDWVLLDPPKEPT